MTIQKQLSHLSFAAIMLVFATLPALAQTGSVDNQTPVATALHFQRDFSKVDHLRPFTWTETAVAINVVTM